MKRWKKPSRQATRSQSTPARHLPLTVPPDALATHDYPREDGRIAFLLERDGPEGDALGARHDADLPARGAQQAPLREHALLPHPLHRRLLRFQALAEKLASLQVALLRKPVEQQMEIHEPRVGPPALKHLPDPVVVEGFAQV